VIPDASCEAFGTFLSGVGEQIVGRLFAAGRASHIQGNLGDGVFLYQGVQDSDHPQFSVWRISLYGAQLGGDAQQPSEIVSHCYVITAPRTVEAVVGFIETIRRRA
jgi:hypothetical protein